MSLMIAFFPDGDTAKKMAIRGGEKPEDIHLTLVYLEYSSPEIFANALRATSRYAARQAEYHSAPTGRTSGFGRFVNAEEPDVLYAGVDILDLDRIRGTLHDELFDFDIYDDAGSHGYTPHMTLKYMRHSDPVPFDRYPEVPLKFDTVSVCSDEMRYDIPVVSNLSVNVQYTYGSDN